MNFSSRLLEAAATVAAFGVDFDALTDEQLRAGHLAAEQVDRLNGIFKAGLAGQVARRSSRELGDAGLAARAGFLSAEAMIQSITGAPRAEAAKYVAVGAVLDSPVGTAVLDGRISVDAAAAIQRGLGPAPDPLDPAMPAEARAEHVAAIDRLIIEAQATDVDRLAKRARDLKDELDAESVARREREQRDLRYLKVYRRGDGMVRGSFLLDPLDGDLVMSALDSVLSPRRGGPRFADPKQRARDAVLVADARSNEQIGADALVAMVRLAVDADPGTMFGSRRPAVRVVVGGRSLATRSGAGQLEDGGEPVSMETIERLICDTGIIGIAFDDDGQCVNVGRTQRLFTQRQRIGLAVRDGGCMFGDCDRPPSWCEAHHIEHWNRDGGKTDIADGILLCRRHHLLVHNNGWEVTRDGADYWLTPPLDVDVTQGRIPMPSKGRALERRAS
jgi:hypothetical protein